MGCVDSAVDETVQDMPSMSTAEQHRSLVAFVRALSEPAMRRSSSEINRKEKGCNTISSIDDLTPLQEAYLSRYKMRIHGCSSDPVIRASTFNVIENEFYNTYNKWINRNVLYTLYGIQ